MAAPHDADALAAALGIADHYLDQLGRRVEISRDTRMTLAHALGFAPSAQTRETMAALQRRALPQWIVIPANQSHSISIRVELIRATWVLDDGQGFVREGRAARDIDLPPLPAGYYQLRAGAHRCFIICAPSRCWWPDVFQNDEAKAWGLVVQAYGLRSQRNAGFGDFLDIAILAAVMAQKGASFLGLSPLHALFPSDRSKISPYSPSSRLFFEPLYLALDVLGCDEQDGLKILREATLLDYRQAWAAKKNCLERLFSRFEAHALSEQHVQRRKAMGEKLESHATFEALSEYFLEQGLHWSGLWPQAFTLCTSPDVQKFARAHQSRIDFHVWLQLLADDQWSAAAQTATSSGMELGLYRDLAVGADRYGSEVWSQPQRYALNLAVGAPPDPLGPQGQNWGFPPFHPLVLQAQDFIAFRELLAANMRGSGAMRMDHAFQLQRLFLIPQGLQASQGGYVAMPLEAMLAILRIESQRHQCMVIAEDLGTGPAGFSARLMREGIITSRLLTFERDATGAFAPAHSYPRAALAALTTHDLPTFRGWRHGFDIDLRACFGVFRENEARIAHGERRRELAQWGEALSRADLDPSARDDLSARNEALRYLAGAPSVLLAVQNEDALDEINQPNLPGLVEGPPNWRRRMSQTLEEASRDNGAFAKIAALMAQESRSLRPEHARLAADPPLATYRLQFHAGFTFADATRALPYLKQLGISHIYASPIQQARKGSAHGYDIVDPRRINDELGGEKAFLGFTEALHDAGLKLIIDIVPNHMGASPENPFWWSVLQLGEASPFARIFDIDWARAAGRLILPVLDRPYGRALKDGAIRLVYDAQRRCFVIAHGDHVFPLADQTLDVEANEDPQEVCALYAREPQRLHALLERQHYFLSSWRMAASRLNYRRFFDINALIAVRAEDDIVFELTHRLILDLVARRQIDGLRIDHIDGLAAPEKYLNRLQSYVGPGFPIYVEKILERGESLREWPVAGTTGYDALNELDGICLHREAREPIMEFYRNVVGISERSEEALWAAKQFVLIHSLGSELDALAEVFWSQAQAEIETRDLPHEALRRALAALIIALPVYRLYGRAPQDQVLLSEAAHAAHDHLFAGDGDALDFMIGLLARGEGHAFSLFGQLTGPVMAKGLEDTFFYRHAPFLALNEVGGDPTSFGLSVSAFHRAQEQRASRWPANLIASATHDTKRGEDARARLLALSAEPQTFLQAGEAFLRLYPQIERRDAWFLFQSLIGAWQIPNQDDLRPRMRAFLRKALRESKLSSSWTDPDEGYELRCLNVLDQILDPGSEAYELISELVAHLAWAGALNGLARTILKMTVPGVPDFYQGTELWDFALVDPDNRRAVDFDLRAHLLAQCQHRSPQILLTQWQDGMIKLWLIARLLHLRAQHAQLFAFGAYEACAGESIAFQRVWGRQRLYVHVLAGTKLAQDGNLIRSGTLCPPHAWHGVKLQLAPGEWRNHLTGSAFGVEGAVHAAEIADGLPWLILGTST